MRGLNGGSFAKGLLESVKERMNSPNKENESEQRRHSNSATGEDAESSARRRKTTEASEGAHTSSGQKEYSPDQVSAVKKYVPASWPVRV